MQLHAARQLCNRVVNEEISNYLAEPYLAIPILGIYHGPINETSQSNSNAASNEPEPIVESNALHHDEHIPPVMEIMNTLLGQTNNTVMVSIQRSSDPSPLPRFRHVWESMRAVEAFLRTEITPTTENIDPMTLSDDSMPDLGENSSEDETWNIPLDYDESDVRAIMETILDDIRSEVIDEMQSQHQNQTENQQVEQERQMCVLM
jgi:hypothetical protein